MDLSSLNDQPVIFLFSAGKDGIVSGDIFRKQYRGKIHWVYLYFVKGFSFVDPILRYYDRAWGIQIEQRPCHETLSIIAQREGKQRQHWTPGMVEKGLQKEFGTKWIVDGIKRCDSLARRGQLKNVRGHIDEKAFKIHPLIEWSDKRVRAYLHLNRLPVPITYSLGPRRSIFSITASMLPWLKMNFPRDYRLLLSEIPEFGDAEFRMEMLDAQKTGKKKGGVKKRGQQI